MKFGVVTPFVGTSVERQALTDLTNHRGRLFFETDTEILYICDGMAWNNYNIVDHDHTGDTGDGGKLEAEDALKVTGGVTGDVLTVQADDSIAAEAGGGGGSDYLLYRDEKASGTDGGTFTSGAWRTRVLNTEVFDTGGYGSLSSNQITLAAGTYIVFASAPAFCVREHKVRWRNVTDSIYIYGTSEFAHNTNYGASRSFVTGRFTIAGSKVFQLEHRCNTDRNTDGLGRNSSFGVAEVYAEVFLEKVA